MLGLLAGLEILKLLFAALLPGVMVDGHNGVGKLNKCGFLSLGGKAVVNAGLRDFYHNSPPRCPLRWLSIFGTTDKRTLYLSGPLYPAKLYEKAKVAGEAAIPHASEVRWNPLKIVISPTLHLFRYHRLSSAGSFLSVSGSHVLSHIGVESSFVGRVDIGNSGTPVRVYCFDSIVCPSTHEVVSNKYGGAERS